MTYREEIDPQTRRRQAVRRMRAIRRLVPMMYTLSSVLIILGASDFLYGFVSSGLSLLLGFVLMIGAYLADSYVDVARDELENLEEES